MDWTLEVVQVPVSDVDRAKAFYVAGLGFGVDFDESPGEGLRFVQLTPPGSGCSIQLSKGFVDMVAGSQRGLVLVVPDIWAAHAQLVENGVPNEGVVVTQDGLGFRPAAPDDELDNVGFVHLTDPDGNQWAVQQISSRGYQPGMTSTPEHTEPEVSPGEVPEAPVNPGEDPGVDPPVDDPA